MEKKTENVQNQAKNKCTIQTDLGYNTVLHPFVHQVGLRVICAV